MRTNAVDPIIAEDSVESEFTRQTIGRVSEERRRGALPRPHSPNLPREGKGVAGFYFGVTETFTRNWLPGL
jgi:hypothetical protein